MKLVCDIEMQGSTTLRDLHLLRLASEHSDKGGSKWLIRHQEGDDIVQDSSPHILAIRSNITFIFELWAEEEKLLGNMDIITALAAFYHTCFVFDLKYPVNGQTIADLIQRLVCKHGDQSGTRTWRRKDNAVNKVEFFKAKVFDLLDFDD